MKAQYLTTAHRDKERPVLDMITGMIYAKNPFLSFFVVKGVRD